MSDPYRPALGELPWVLVEYEPVTGEKGAVIARHSPARPAMKRRCSITKYEGSWAHTLEMARAKRLLTS